jgi:hypothetical protein
MDHRYFKIEKKILLVSSRWTLIRSLNALANWCKVFFSAGFKYVSQIYLWRKVVCLFCLFLWDPLNQDASECVLSVFGKLSMRRSTWAWFHGVWTCRAKVLEYWMISSLKMKLNRSWKFWRKWNVPLVLLERSWWARFNGIYLVRFGIRIWEILIFKWFLLLKIQINAKNPGFEMKNQLGCGNTWANGTSHTS